MGQTEDLSRRNRAVAGAAVGIVVVMGGLVALSPIFYGAFSSFLGYGGSLETGKTARSLTAAGIGKDIDVRFAANVGDSLDVTFRPEKRTVTADIGRPENVYFDIANNGADPVVIRIAFDVTPGWAAPYFFKSVGSFHAVERMAAGEQARVPLVFYVDRRILKDKLAARVGAITLSYTLLRQRGVSRGAHAGIGDLGDRGDAMTAKLRSARTVTFANDATSN